MKTMKCWMLRIGLVLILGSISTVAIALVLAALHTLHSPLSYVEQPIGPVDEMIRSYADRAINRYEWNVAAFEDAVIGSTIRGCTTTPTFGLAREPSPSLDLIERSAGLPCRAFVGARWLTGGASVSGTGTIDHPFRDQSSAVFPFPSEFLPVRPVWRGLAINTLFYGVVWFVLIFGSGSTRRLLRRRRGRCPRCAYDLQARFDGGCPECGWGR